MNFSFFGISDQGVGLDCCDIEWLALEMKGYHSVFETAPKNCILESSVDYEGYSVSSKGFLPTEADMMVILRHLCGVSVTYMGLKSLAWAISFGFPQAGHSDLPGSQSTFGISQDPPMCAHMYLLAKMDSTAKASGQSIP